MRFHEFDPKNYEVVVAAPETVATPEVYRTFDTEEVLLHIPIEAPEKASKRRKIYLLAWMAMKELEQKPPTEHEWETCRRAFEIMKKIASKDYELTQLKNKNKQSAKTSFAEIEL